MAHSLSSKFVFYVTSVNVPFRYTFNESLGMRSRMGNRMFHLRLEIVDSGLREEEEQVSRVKKIDQKAGSALQRVSWTKQDEGRC